MFHLDFGILAFYVDDIILTTHNLAFLVYFKNFLKDEYELIDLKRTPTKYTIGEKKMKHISN
jgi:hypothetical protein